MIAAERADFSARVELAPGDDFVLLQAARRQQCQQGCGENHNPEQDEWQSGLHAAPDRRPRSVARSGPISSFPTGAASP